MPAIYSLRAYSICEVGKRKDAQGNPHQEDSIFPTEVNINDAGRLFILCDGMGGHDAGEVASATVCEAMGHAITSNARYAEGKFTESDLDAALKAAFDALDKADAGTAEKKMGTTMTLLRLHNNGATIAHIGDSRVYHIRPGKTGADTRILFQTEDHSLVNDLIRVGELTRDEARHSKQKNVITRAMQPGLSNRPKADVHHISDIRPGDYFYLCSDGMLEQDDMDSGETLRNIFSEQGGNDNRKLEILKGATAENRDNHTAFLIHIIDVEGLPAKSENEAPAPLSPAPTRAEKKRGGLKVGSLIVRIIIVAAVIILCFLAVRIFSSDKEDKASSAEEIEQTEQTDAPEQRGETNVRPSRHHIETVTPLPQKEHEQAAPAKEQNVAPAKKEEQPVPDRKVNLPSRKTDNDEEVVNSDQQTILDNLNKKK